MSAFAPAVPFRWLSGIGVRSTRHDTHPDPEIPALIVDANVGMLGGLPGDDRSGAGTGRSGVLRDTDGTGRRS